jgi:hypothetical protein
VAQQMNAGGEGGKLFAAAVDVSFRFQVSGFKFVASG